MPDIGPFIRTDYKAVDKRDEMRNVLGWVRGDTSELPVIVDQGKPFGIVSDRALLGRRIDPKTKIEGFVLTTRAMMPDASVADAMERMAEFRAAHLPVEDGRGNVAGYVAALDLIRQQSPTATAGDLSVPVSTMREDETLGQAHHLFSKEYVDYLPVIDKQGKVSGVVPRRTLVMMDARQRISRGRKDAVGEVVHPGEDAIVHFLDQRLPWIDLNAPLDKVLATIDDFGYALVRGPSGSFHGLVTAETLVQRLAQRA